MGGHSRCLRSRPVHAGRDGAQPGREHCGPENPSAAAVYRVARLQVMGRVQALYSGAAPGTRVLPITGAPRLPAGLSNSAPSARGPGEESAHGPGQQTHQPRPRASAQKAASSSSVPEATLVSRRGSLHRDPPRAVESTRLRTPAALQVVGDRSWCLPTRLRSSSSAVLL
ncbi:hypothetical protein NDU88_002954 [Pleurodeles waltl]|uniref:Uncharacterized protein n=1 Tax=Pleurodeles waltl TaxID=8319 RepID=A0AAV7LQP5_PLEWA|nr:hypothetical protein NDU88_002954 [Pleurodeles waltl]